MRVFECVDLSSSTKQALAEDIWRLSRKTRVDDWVKQMGDPEQWWKFALKHPELIKRNISDDEK